MMNTKNNKPPAFLICENPIADKSDGRLFIIHNRSPMMLAEVHHFENMSEADQMAFQRNHAIGGRLDYSPETIFFLPVWIEGKPENSQNYADRLAGIFRRMADWYKSYLIWEDEQWQKNNMD